MRSNFVVVSMSVAGIIAAGVLFAEEEEHDTPVAQKDIPANVMKTAVQFSDGGTFDSAVIADEDGLKVYEVHFKKGERKIEVQTTTAGAFFAAEEHVAETVAPDFVKQRVAKLFKPGTKLTYERTVHVYYEVSSKDAAGHETEYLVDESGAALQEIAGGIAEEHGKK